ncbi:hypothetical protein ACWDA3_40655 [Nonomuraea rubra]
MRARRTPGRDHRHEPGRHLLVQNVRDVPTPTAAPRSPATAPGW